MSNQVEVKFGADATGLAKETEKMRAQINSLKGTIDDLKNKSKRAGKEGAFSFREMGNELKSFALKTVAVTAVLNNVVNVIGEVINKAKELRALRDQSAIGFEDSLRKVNLEYGFEGTNQDKMRGYIEGITKAKKGLSTARVAEFIVSAGNQGVKPEDFYSGKMNSAFDLMNINQDITGDQTLNMIETGLVKNKKSFKSFDKKDIEKVSRLYATMGSDFSGSQAELSQLNEKIGLKESLVLIEMAKRQHFGKGKKSASDINEGFKKSGMMGALKSAGFKSRDEFNKALIAMDEDSQTALDVKKRIQTSSRQAGIVSSEANKQIEFARAKIGKESDQEIINKIETNSEVKNEGLLKRYVDEQNINYLGAETAERMSDPVKSIVRDLLKVLNSNEKKIDQQNNMRSKDFGSQKIEQNDSKDKR